MLTNKISEVESGHGVYRLHSLVTGDDYVGSTTDVISRLRNHRTLIKRGKHLPNIQIAFPNGLVDLQFEVIERPAIDALKDREREWILTLGAKLNQQWTADWEGVDWLSKTDEQIAEETGYTQHSVYLARRELGYPPSPRVRLAGGGLNCPTCGKWKFKVIDSRPSLEGLRRRRQCLHCKTRITTYERIAIVIPHGPAPRNSAVMAYQ